MSARLILIHGISQDPAGKELLLNRWRDLILVNAKHPEFFAELPTSMAFYADVLGPATDAAEIVFMGAPMPGNADELAFVSAGLVDIANAAGFNDRAIDRAAGDPAELQVVAQSSAMGRALVGALAALEKRLPSAGILGVRVLKEAYVYLTRPAVRDAVDDRVRAELDKALATDDRVCVVSHSLGTVIAFRLLRELARSMSTTPRVPLLVTMGSPLAIAAVRTRIGLPREVPANVTRSANFYDRGDVVALGQGLTASNFATGIDNDGDVNNGTANAHSIDGYLDHAHVTEAIELAMSRG